MLTSTITFPVAFSAGIVSFFAPCVLPLLPVYISYVTGVSLNELKENGYKKYRRKMLVSSLFYILGFSLLFTILGITAGGVGYLFRLYAREIQIIGGIILVLLGLDFAGQIRLPFSQKQTNIKLPNWVKSSEWLRSFTLGLIFAVTWTPCIGAVLGGIYAIAATSGSAITGGALLFVYSLGISTPFLIVSFTLASAPKYLKFISSKIEIINKISGFVLAILGILLITGYYAHLNAFIFNIAYGLGYEIY